MRAIASLAVRVLGMTSAVVSMSCTAAPQHAAVQRPGFPNSGVGVARHQLSRRPARRKSLCRWVGRRGEFRSGRCRQPDG